MRASVDLPDPAGQQILSDGTIGIAPSSVQPPSITSSGPGIDNNPRQRECGEGL